MCEKTFQTEPSLKQHIKSVHKKTVELPIGHPDRFTEQERVTQQNMQYSCNLCGCIFRFQNQIQNHMKEHRTNFDSQQGFVNQNVNRACRYYRRGYCAKGDQSEFKHGKSYQNYTPACNRGSECRYLSQNRCYFYHQGIGVQKPRMQQDFRFGSMRNRPPMVAQNMSAWLE